MREKKYIGGRREWEREREKIVGDKNDGREKVGRGC